MVKQESVYLAGELEICIYDVKTRRLLQRLFGKNLLVNNFMEAFGKLFANGTGDYKITTFKVGASSTPPTVDQTDLISPRFTKACNSVTYSMTTKEVVATTTLEDTEANTTLAEAGLFSGGSVPVMLARRVFPEFTKTSDFTVDFIWRIKVFLS